MSLTPEKNNQNMLCLNFNCENLSKSKCVDINTQLVLGRLLSQDTWKYNK